MVDGAGVAVCAATHVLLCMHVLVMIVMVRWFCRVQFVQNYINCILEVVLCASVKLFDCCGYCDSMLLIISHIAIALGAVWTFGATAAWLLLGLGSGLGIRLGLHLVVRIHLVCGSGYTYLFSYLLHRRLLL